MHNTTWVTGVTVARIGDLLPHRKTRSYSLCAQEIAQDVFIQLEISFQGLGWPRVQAVPGGDIVPSRCLRMGKDNARPPQTSADVTSPPVAATYWLTCQQLGDVRLSTWGGE